MNDIIIIIIIIAAAAAAAEYGREWEMKRRMLLSRNVNNTAKYRITHKYFLDQDYQQ
jgi:hypothetical protein